MSSSPSKSRGRGRGYNANSVQRSYDGNSGNRGNRQGGDYNRGSYNRGGYNRGSYNRGGYIRGGHHESRNMVDNNLINIQNVQWGYNTSQVGLAEPEFVKRNGYLSDKFGRKIKLMTNHFSFKFSPDVRIYHYNFSWLYYDKDGEEPIEKKLNSYECYKLFDAVMTHYPQYFKNASVGFDGRANVYLPFELGPEAKDLLVSGVELEGEVKKFSVTFKGGKVIPLASLKEYYAGSKTDDIKRESLQDAIQALHIILKFPSRYKMIALGRLAMFPVDARRHYLSNLMELALGHRKSLRFSEIGFTLVVDRASAAFFKSGSALDFVVSIINLNNIPLSDFRPGPEHITALKRAFVNVKISTDHLKNSITNIGFTKKYVVKAIAEEAASVDTFQINENGKVHDVTVAEYFEKKHRRILKYPNLPCIITTNGSRIPIEMCVIVPDQSSQSIKRLLTADEKAEMIKLTATAPDERFTCLLKAHAQICGQVNEALGDFKLDIDVKPLGLEGIVLNAPRLSYRGEEITPKDGTWNLQGKTFYIKKNFDKFGVLNFCATDKEGDAFCQEFIKKAREMGMTTDRKPLFIMKDLKDYKKRRQNDLFDAIKNALTEMLKKSCTFALCIFPEEKSIYNLTKMIADTILYFPTQGVSLKNVQRCSFQTIANILAKVNKKLGGVNVIIKENNKPDLLTFKLKNKIMIIGADVTHPGEGDDLISSVAASVSTYDSNHTMFYPSVRVQPKKEGKEGKKIVEVIKDFKSMIQEHLANFKNVNGSFPEIILYLRDGVSDGQYKQILNEEVVHLTNPYGNNYKPRVTAVIISKRILTRSRPIDQKDGVGKNFNVPPGTTIDRIITHPSDFDYFQYGHKGIMGTSRPCHYYMVHDDNKLTIDVMAKISYYLCHIFERSTSSTSAPAPVMHAHNLAFKVRQWICAIDSKCDLKGLRGEERFVAEEKIARDLNSRFSNINDKYARSSMFYI